MVHTSRVKNIFLFLFLATAILDIVLLFQVASSSHTKSLVPPSGNIVIAGSVVCLPKRNTKGPQTMECAYGLKDAQGRFFALSDTDSAYKNISSVSVNAHVLVQGAFQASGNTQYPTIGVIQVKSITTTVSPTF